MIVNLWSLFNTHISGIHCAQCANSLELLISKMPSKVKNKKIVIYDSYICLAPLVSILYYSSVIRTQYTESVFSTMYY